MAAQLSPGDSAWGVYHQAAELSPSGGRASSSSCTTSPGKGMALLEDAHISHPTAKPAENGTDIDRVLRVLSDLISVASDATGVDLSVSQSLSPRSPGKRVMNFKDDSTNLSVSLSETSDGTPKEEARYRVNLRGRICGAVDSPRLTGLMQMLGCSLGGKELQTDIEPRQSQAQGQELYDLRDVVSKLCCEEQKLESQERELNELREALHTLRRDPCSVDGSQTGDDGKPIPHVLFSDHTMNQLDVNTLRDNFRELLSDKQRLETKVADLDALRRAKNKKMENQERVIAELQQNLDRSSCGSSTTGMEADELSVAVDQLQNIKCDLLGWSVELPAEARSREEEFQGRITELSVRNLELEAIVASRDEELSVRNLEFEAIVAARDEELTKLRAQLGDGDSEHRKVRDMQNQELTKLRAQLGDGDSEHRKVRDMQNQVMQLQVSELDSLRLESSLFAAREREVAELRAQLEALEGEGEHVAANMLHNIMVGTNPANDKAAASIEDPLPRRASSLTSASRRASSNSTLSVSFEDVVATQRSTQRKASSTSQVSAASKEGTPSLSRGSGGASATASPRRARAKPEGEESSSVAAARYKGMTPGEKTIAMAREAAAKPRARPRAKPDGATGAWSTGLMEIRRTAQGASAKRDDFKRRASVAASVSEFERDV